MRITITMIKQKTSMITRMKKLSIAMSIVVLTSCASSSSENETDDVPVLERQRTLGSSFLSEGEYKPLESDLANKQDLKERTGQPEFIGLSTMERSQVRFNSQEISGLFDASKSLQVSANKMKSEDFIHYVFGELLKVNYLLTPSVSENKSTVTLNLNTPVDEQKLFHLAEAALIERELIVKYQDGVFLISKLNPESKGSTVVGLGRTVESVPVGRDILQVVPIIYGIKTTLKHTIEQLADVKINIDTKQSALFISGEYADIVRAIELVNLLDSPANRGKYIGLVKLVYTSVDTYLLQLSALLENEGIPNGIVEPGNENLTFVPLPQIGSVAVFAATEELYERVKFWTRTVDQPIEGDVKQYFIFYPKYARANDIGLSLTPLIEKRQTGTGIGTASSAAANNADSKGSSTGALTKATRVSGGSSEDLTFVIDERANALIFYSTGTEYRNVLPLIRRLDTLPKQVMLDVMVAEVRLQDKYKFGVEWAIENGRFSGGTSLGGIESNGFSFLFDNGQGETLQADFYQDDQNIDILTNPSLLVRDGVTASLDIGADIAVVGSATTDPNNGVTQSVEYRKTGVKISIKPTINAQGIVIMEINESISNEVEGGVGASDNPNIFERNLVTEVVAESGQTIILGGLIDESTTVSESKVPVLGDIPWLGRLFKAESEEKVKTELVLLITPKVINRTDQWNSIKSSFNKNYENIVID